MDAMEIARDITVAIISNPNYKPGTGKTEVGIFATALREVTKTLGGKKGKKVKEAPNLDILLDDRIIPTVKDMRSKTTHLKSPVTM
jgi:hypothetical protein